MEGKMIWVTSDLHFNHQKLIDNGVRPENYEAKLIKQWNGTVRDGDIVIILGDISWKDGYKKLEQLKGKKILVRGNHDYKSCETYMNDFAFACDSFTMDYKGTNILFTHQPVIHVNADLNIHGHLHGRTNYEKKKHYLISLENMGYGVFSLPAIVKDWKRKNGLK